MNYITSRKKYMFQNIMNWLKIKKWHYIEINFWMNVIYDFYDIRTKIGDVTCLELTEELCRSSILTWLWCIDGIIPEKYNMVNNIMVFDVKILVSNIWRIYIQ